MISQTTDPRRDTSRIVRSAFIILQNETEYLVAYSYYSTESNGTWNTWSREFVSIIQVKTFINFLFAL